MKQRTKDLILVYAMFIVYGIFLIVFYSQVVIPLRQNADSTSKYSIVEENNESNRCLSNAIQIVEQDEFPSGDEFASAICLLQGYGYDLNYYDLLNNMNYSSTDFYTSYIGDAKTDVGYCYPPALVVCVNNYLSYLNTSMRFKNISGIAFDKLINYISNSQAAIIWVTSDYEEPIYTGTFYNDRIELYQNPHPVVLYRTDDDYAYIADSSFGKITIPLEELKQLWEQCGSMSIGVYWIY